MPMTESQVMPGPCVACGMTDYPLSMGGPGICPWCDCHGAEGGLRFQLNTVTAERDELAREVARLKGEAPATHRAPE